MSTSRPLGSKTSRQTRPTYSSKRTYIPHDGVAAPVGRGGAAEVGASVAEEALREGEEGREASAHPAGPEPRDDLTGRARVADVEKQVPQLGGVARRGGADEERLRQNGRRHSEVGRG